MHVHYLQIVSPDVDAVCAAYAGAGGLAFGEPDAGLGNARTASLPRGAMPGVRAPLHEDDAAVADAERSGALALHPPLENPGHGTFAIHEIGSIQHGL